MTKIFCWYSSLIILLTRLETTKLTKLMNTELTKLRKIKNTPIRYLNFFSNLCFVKVIYSKNKHIVTLCNILHHSPYLFIGICSLINSISSSSSEDSISCNYSAISSSSNDFLLDILQYENVP